MAEGIPPVSHKLVEKIRKWEYIELSSLLEDHYPPDQMALFNGQLMVVSSFSQRCRQAAVISDILSWLQAFSIYTAILVSSETTTKEEAAGLAAHAYLILQLSKDLKGPQWLKYDQSYHEWAAAKGIWKWGEMNFSIYGRCLASQQTSTTYYPPALWVKASRERQLPKYATGGTMGSTVTALLAAFVTAAVFVGEVTRPQDVPKHQSVPKGFDMLTMIIFTVATTINMYIYMFTMHIVYNMHICIFPCSRWTRGS